MQGFFPAWTLAAALMLGGSAASGAADTPVVFHADFAKWAGPPLVKTKFGVYETPFLKKADLAKAAALLPEAGVRDLRYEMGWGKPDTYAFDQISGTAAAPTIDLKIDFTPLDPFVRELGKQGVLPLFAMTYDPVPLKSGTEWQRWKDMPSNLAAWQDIQRRYAAHYRDAVGLSGPLYEMWNEPDIPGDGGKMFFNGSAADYAALYGVGAAGIRAGDPDAEAGGPAAAYDLGYAKPLLSPTLPAPDFLSIHAYDNYAGQLAGLRGLVTDRPGVPLLLTEYASFTSYGPREPVSRYPAAARFFRDVKGMLALTDVPKVYWAQWVDDSIGMLTRDFHRKALFNAYKVYQTLLPVDRNTVRPDGAGGLDLMAASDAHTAGVVLWNNAQTAQTATVYLDHLPFGHGTLRLSRIDAAHASCGDDPAQENLTINGDWPVTGPSAVWTGTVPAESVVFLRATDGKALPPVRPIGTQAGTRYWFPDRMAGAYADFDPRTSVIRVGIGSKDKSLAQQGIVLDKPAARLRAHVTRQGPFRATEPDSLFGLRVDYRTSGGVYGKSVLWRSGPGANPALPWGTKRPADAVRDAPGLMSGRVFVLDIKANAPPGWTGRVIVTPILQNMGAHSQARIALEGL